MGAPEVGEGAGTSVFWLLFFFFNDTATTEIYTLSLHDALPIPAGPVDLPKEELPGIVETFADRRSEEHTSELQSRSDIVCRLLLEKKKKQHAEESASDEIARIALDYWSDFFCSATVAEVTPARQCFFFNDTATTEIYTLSLHDALPI